MVVYIWDLRASTWRSWGTLGLFHCWNGRPGSWSGRCGWPVVGSPAARCGSSWILGRGRRPSKSAAGTRIARRSANIGKVCPPLWPPCYPLSQFQNFEIKSLKSKRPNGRCTDDGFLDVGHAFVIAGHGKLAQGDGHVLLEIERPALALAQHLFNPALGQACRLGVLAKVRQTALVVHVTAALLQ